ncbi:RNA polymerase sigma factor [Silvibacterium sp.]|uniref:RNA polymerase sigma factor n=1 Tax=Silvibacterium sp. TaxID=1964179 RepID=UPI0039E4599E
MKARATGAAVSQLMRHVNLSDSQLVAAAKLGDHHALEVLLQRHSRRVYRAILRITRNQEDAEDALQNTLIKAYLHLDSFDGRAQFSSWLIRIGINSALAMLRWNRARPQLSLDDESVSSGISDDRLRDTSLDTEHIYLEQEQLMHLRRAVGRLRPKLREILLLHHSMDCTTRELADHTGISESAVKSRLMRARRELARTYNVARPGPQVPQLLDERAVQY